MIEKTQPDTTMSKDDPALNADILRGNRIIEFINWGNLYGARAFLQFWIDDSVKAGLYGPDEGVDWRAMYEKEKQEGLT